MLQVFLNIWLVPSPISSSHPHASVFPSPAHFEVLVSKSFLDKVFLRSKLPLVHNIEKKNQILFTSLHILYTAIEVSMLRTECASLRYEGLNQNFKHGLFFKYFCLPRLWMVLMFVHCLRIRICTVWVGAPFYHVCKIEKMTANSSQLWRISLEFFSFTSVPILSAECKKIIHTI